MKITHVRVSFKDGRYHRVTEGQKEPRSKLIPHFLYDVIVSLQTALDDLHLQAKRYNEPIKDKPMTVYKNHIEPIVVAPGETVRFTSDETAETALRGSPEADPHP